MFGKNPPRKAPKVGTIKTVNLSAAESYFTGKTLSRWVEAGWEVIGTANALPGTTTFTLTYRGQAAIGSATPCPSCGCPTPGAH